jgi:hypothetical protein
MTCAAVKGAPVILAAGDKRTFAVIEEGGSRRVFVSKGVVVDASTDGPLCNTVYGSVFAFTGANKTLTLITPPHATMAGDDDDGGGGSAAAASVLDNRALVDDGSSQALTPEHIAAMKREGATGGEVVRKLVENSATFTAKTQFAQEKYIRRKKKKFVVPEEGSQRAHTPACTRPLTLSLSSSGTRWSSRRFSHTLQTLLTPPSGKILQRSCEKQPVTDAPAVAFAHLAYPHAHAHTAI